MALFRTSNPALREETFTKLGDNQYGNGSGILLDAADRMSLAGTVNKTGILLLCCLGTALWTWHLFLADRDPASITGLMLLGLIAGFILAMITIFVQKASPFTAPLYALAEGLALGGLSAMLEVRYPGIAIQAVSLTFGTLFVLLFLYSSHIIKVTDKLRLGIVAATGGIAFFYLIEMVAGIFGFHFTAVNNSSPLSIGFSIFVVIIAALNLVLNFDIIERGVQAGAPKYMEWYGAFGIMVTLVWLYLEILRLLSKVRSRN
jgi:uncharacterized YccA/Bax inhibitor family protein